MLNGINKSGSFELRQKWVISKHVQLMLVVAALITASSMSVAQQADGEVDIASVIEMRQTNYADLGSAYKSMTDELRKKKPGRYMYGRYLKQLVNLSHDQAKFDWFPAGSGPESGLETAATPEIWTKNTEFREWVEALPVEADKLQEIVANKGEISEIKAQHKALGKTCKGCHEPFRVEED